MSFNKTQHKLICPQISLDWAAAEDQVGFYYVNFRVTSFYFVYLVTTCDVWSCFSHLEEIKWNKISLNSFNYHWRWAPAPSDPSWMDGVFILLLQRPLVSISWHWYLTGLFNVKLEALFYIYLFYPDMFLTFLQMFHSDNVPVKVKAVHKTSRKSSFLRWTLTLNVSHPAGFQQL